MNLPALISWGEDVYEPDGYRVPGEDDIFISTRGRVTRVARGDDARDKRERPQTARLCLRLFEGVER